MKRTFSTRFLAAMLCVLQIVIYLPGSITSADPVSTSIADPKTLSNWTKWFPAGSSRYAGGIYVDKSVYTATEAKSDSYFSDIHSSLNFGKDKFGNENFLVALSAIGSNSEVFGYAYLPTDTVIVLDASTSMGTGGAASSSIDDMVAGANEAAKRLLALNHYNRVSVVIYNGSSNVLLPLDSYSVTTDLLTYQRPGSTNRIYVSSGVRDGNGNTVAQSYISQASGTYTQGGIYAAAQQLLNADTVIEDGKIQGGTKRIPVMVLMTDGDPTYGSVNYLQPTRETMSNSSSSYTTNSEVVFLTQLTAAYTRAFMEDHYGRTPLFYTLGLGVEGNHAPQVLNPKLSESLVAQSVNSFWDSYKNSAKNGQISGLLVKTDWRGNEYTENGNCTYGGADVKKLDDVLRADRIYANRQYVDKYFPANDAQAMVDAFDSIVQEIIMQSQYYPTLVSSGKYDMDGYVSMVDELGEFMEVKDVHGMMLGDTLFSGKAFVEAANNGVYGNASTWTETGWELVYSISERLKFPTTRQSNCCAVHSTKARLVKTAAITPT